MSLGTTFIAIDSDAIGDGGNYTLLVDTWLQRRMQHNLEDVLSRGHLVCMSPYSSSADDFTSLAGIRPYTAFEWHTVWVGWVAVEKDQTGAQFTFSYHSTVPGGSTDAGDVHLRVQIGGEEQADVLGKTYSAGELTGHQTVEVAFESPVQQDGWVEVNIAVKSVLSGTGVASGIGGSANGTTGAVLEMTRGDVKLIENTAPGASAVFCYNSAGTSPDQASLETMFLKLGKSGLVWPDAAYDPQHDFLWTNPVNTGGQCAGGVVQALPEPMGPSDLVSGTAVRNQCFLLRSFCYEPVFSSVTAPFAASATLPPERLAPRLEFGSPEMMHIAAMARRAYLQPRTQLVGPRGRKVNYNVATLTHMDAFDYHGYGTHWPMVQGDYTDLAVGQFTDVINDQFWMDTIDPQLQLNCLWVSVQINAPYGGQGGQVAETGFGKNKRKTFDKGKVDYNDRETSALWDMTILVDQMADAAAATADWDTEATSFHTETTGKRIPVHGCQPGNTGGAPPAVLRGIYAMASLGKATANPPSFWFKEGSLFPEDLSAGVLFETTHDIDVSGMDAAACNLPFRLKVNMNLDTFDRPIFTASSATINGQIRLFLVGFSLVEIPKEP